MYFGKPVIATASGGPQELIEHLKSGYIVPVGDINAMVEAMILLASNRELSNELARGGYYAIREKLSENNTVLRLSKCYDLALKTK
jgi:glycosyltransferase involved in cell wall biosynthesis